VSFPGRDNTRIAMKTTLLTLLAVLCVATTTAFAQPLGQPMPVRRLPGSPPPGPPLDADAANYQIRVQWKEAAGGSNLLQIVTAEGGFKVNTAQVGKVKINNSDMPITLSLNGDLELLSADKARLRIFLGRTMPYVTGTSSGGPGGGSFQQMQQLQLGLDATIVVTFDKPLVIQSDEREEITLTVKRLER